MKIISSVKEINAILHEYKNKGLKIGFVPTMGALHQGHLSLINIAQKKCDVVVCSIFVNPTQFNNKKDLVKYPRNIEKDAKMLRKAGCNLLFSPTEKEIYPKGLNTSVNVDFNGLDKMMEGEFRPGHFAGVAQVVKRLLDIVVPDFLYMGQKDFQQFTIVAQMLKKLKLHTKLVVCPILREENGLAMSSRNERLSKDLRNRAAIIYKTLQWAFRNRRKYPVKVLEKLAMDRMTIPNFKPEYFSIVDAKTLKPIKQIGEPGKAVACVAVWAEDVRLIDNKLF